MHLLGQPYVDKTWCMQTSKRPPLAGQQYNAIKWTHFFNTYIKETIDLFLSKQKSISLEIRLSRCSDKKKNENRITKVKQPNAVVNWDFNANVAPATRTQVQHLRGRNNKSVCTDAGGDVKEQQGHNSGRFWRNSYSYCSFSASAVNIPAWVSKNLLYHVFPLYCTMMILTWILLEIFHSPS